jgi:hypothetical protein
MDDRHFLATKQKFLKKHRPPFHPATPPPTHQMDLGVSPSQSERASKRVADPAQTNRGRVVGGLRHPLPRQHSTVVDPLKSPHAPFWAKV